MNKEEVFVIIKGEYEDQRPIGILTNVEEDIAKKYCAQANWYSRSKLKNTEEDRDNKLSYRKICKIPAVIDPKLKFNTEYSVVFDRILNSFSIREEYRASDMYVGEIKKTEIINNGWTVKVKITADSEGEARLRANNEVIAWSLNT